jgi:hypothetical protein
MLLATYVLNVAEFTAISTGEFPTLTVTGEWKNLLNTVTLFELRDRRQTGDEECVLVVSGTNDRHISTSPDLRTGTKKPHPQNQLDIITAEQQEQNEASSARQILSKLQARLRTTAIGGRQNS